MIRNESDLVVTGGRSMMKRLLLISALSVGYALLPTLADALPLDQGLRSTSGEVMLVREACGPGRQYSEALKRCVADTAGARSRDVRQDVGRCGVGLRYDDRLKRCVRI
jgi:hypothetical protein